MIALLFLNLALASQDLATVQKSVLKDLPLLVASEEKIRAAQAQLRSQDGSFDTKIKGTARGQEDVPSYNRFWELKLEKQTPYRGLNLYAGRRQGNGTYATYEGKSSTSAIGEMFAGFEIPLLRDAAMDQVRLDRAQAALALKRSELEWQQKALETILKASELYWKWVALGQKLRVVEEWVKIAEERQHWIERKWKTGDISQIKWVDSRRSLFKRQSELVKVRREFSVVSQELKLYVPQFDTAAEHVPHETQVKPSAAPPQLEALPTYKLFENEREALEQDKQYARALALPDLRLGLEGARDLSQNLPAGRQDQGQLRAAVRLEIPLENRKGLGKREEVAFKLRSLWQRREWFEREWKTRLEQNKLAREQVAQQLSLQTQELSDTTRVAQAEVKRLQQGESDVFFVNIREQDEAETKLRIIDTHVLQALLELERSSLDGTLASMVTTQAKEYP